MTSLGEAAGPICNVALEQLSQLGPRGLHELVPEKDKQFREELLSITRTKRAKRGVIDAATLEGSIDFGASAVRGSPPDPIQLVADRLEGASRRRGEEVGHVAVLGK